MNAEAKGGPALEGRKPVVLVFVRYYLPGFKSGGPVRSISNLVARLGDEYDFRIVCLDRDVLDARPYPGVRTDAWTPVNLALVWYLGRRPGSLIRFAAAVRALGPYTLYLNSLFDPLFSLLPMAAKAAGLISPSRVIVAPRGELSPGALDLRRGRKSIFLAFARRAGLYRGVHWHASTLVERGDIIAAFPRATLEGIFGRLERDTDSIHVARNIFVASDLVKLSLNTPNYNLGNSLVFLSRITPKKNLDFALRALALCRSAVELHIYGTIEDPRYWEECRRIIQDLPSHVRAVYEGPLEPEEVSCTLRRHSLFLFPTRGENYGHVIAEALAAGLPALLSDQTPWTDLEKSGAGWIRPLSSPQAFAEVIDGFLAQPEGVRRARAEDVSAYAREKLCRNEDVENNRKLLNMDFPAEMEGSPAPTGAGYGD